MNKDRQSERERRRAAEACNAPSVTPAPTAPPVRPTAACDPVPAPPTTDQFFAPDASAAVVVSSLDIQPVPIGNDFTQVACADVEGGPPTGDSVSVLADSVSQDFSWLLFSDITQPQLKWLVTLDIDLVREFLLQHSLDDAVDFFHLTRAQTSAAQVEAARLKAEVNKLAYDSAITQLACFWENIEQSAECEAGALQTFEQELTTLPVLNPSLVVAGSIRSQESQTVADQEAQQLALANLQCVFPNAELILTCNDLGYVETVPTDSAPLPPQQRGRRGSVLVAAASFFSPVSAADANDMARLFAEAQLACFYLNDALVVTCESIGKLSTADVGPGNAQSETQGNPVTVPANIVASDISTEDANLVALELGTSLLQCIWLNAEKTFSCPPRTINDPLNPEVQLIIPPSPRSPAITATIAAGTIQSAISQEDADDQAEALALAQLQCLYCNLKVDPRCIPPDIQAQLDAGTLTLPLPLSLVNSTWSPDATLGIAANTYCDPDPTIAQLVAETGIEPPISVLGPTGECRFGNDAFTGGCGPTGATASSETDTGGQATVPKNTFMITSDDVPAAFKPGEANREKQYANALAQALTLSILVCLFFNRGRDFTCKKDKGKPNVHEDSTGTDEKPVRVEPSTFVSARNQAEVDRLEEEFGKAQLVCFYMSREVQGLCGDDPKAERSGGGGTNNAAGLKLGDGTMTPSDGSAGGRTQVDKDSLGSTSNPVVIAKNSIMSWKSQDDADDQAVEIAASMLFCFWRNVAVELMCGDDVTSAMPWTVENNDGQGLALGSGYKSGGWVTTTPGKAGEPFKVEADVFTSHISRKHATRAAYDIALAGILCCWGNKVTAKACDIPEQPGVTQQFSGFAVHESELEEDAMMSCKDQLTANESAEKLLQALLLCSFTNNEVTYNKCSGGITIGAQTAQGGQFHDAGGSEGPTQQAQAQLEAGQYCMDPNEFSGNDGRQTDCEGTCLAFYS